MAIFRSFLLSGRCSSLSRLKLFSSVGRFIPVSPTSLSNPISLHPKLTLATFSSISTPAISIQLPLNTHILTQPFTSNPDPPEPRSRNPKLVNFSLSDSESDTEQETLKGESDVINKTKLPPPYDPFNKKPTIEEVGDPKNLQEVFHKLRSEGLMNNAVKMFDGLSKMGLTHEALELFRIIKDKSTMPEVVAHTAVIEAYAEAEQPREALKVFLRMLSSGVAPNAYTYTVLIKGLVRGDEKMVREAKKYLLEMVEKGMKPNVQTYTAALEALVKEGKEEGREVVEIMKGKGIEFDEKSVKEVLKGKRGPVTNVINILFGK